MQQIESAYKDSFTKSAGVLAPILVANLELAPAVAAIIVTLVIQKIAKQQATPSVLCGKKV